MVELNPRSFKSIKQAVAEGRVKSRGDLARQTVDAFRKPIDARKAEAKRAAMQPTKTPTSQKNKSTQSQG